MKMADGTRILRRNRPGVKAKDFSRWPDEPFDEMDSTLAVQQYIQQQIRREPSNIELILTPPDSQDEGVWKYEHLRQFCMELNGLAVRLQNECHPDACTQMTATEQWIFLCAAHKTPKECPAIDYTRHTLDGAACLLNSNKYFPSRVSIKESSVAKLGSVCRRVYRIFSHAYFHHRTIFDEFERAVSQTFYQKMVLEEYKTTIGTAASVSSFGILFAPVFVCLSISKRGTTKDIPVDRFLEALIRSALSLQQGLIIAAWPLVTTHTIGLLMGVVYLAVYTFYTHDKRELKQKFFVCGAVIAGLILYAHLEDRRTVEWRFGYILSAFNLGTLVFHLIKTKDIIKAKCTKSLPLPILLNAIVVTFLWILYGIAMNKVQLQLQAGFAFMVVAIQLSMFLIYPHEPLEKPKTK